jgi:hypothetical protein
MGVQGRGTMLPPRAGVYTNLRRLFAFSQLNERNGEFLNNDAKRGGTPQFTSF